MKALKCRDILKKKIEPKYPKGKPNRTQIIDIKTILNPNSLFKTKSKPNNLMQSNPVKIPRPKSDLILNLKKY